MFNRKRVLTTTSSELKEIVEELLVKNNIWFKLRIKYLDKTRNIGSRSLISPTNFGETVSSIEYSFIVKKDDYEKARRVISR